MMVAADTDSKSAMRARFEAFEGTKLYDLVAALPFIAWCVVYVSAQVSGFMRSLAATDLRSADAMFFAQAASTGASVVFISFVIALLVVRRSPRGKAQGLFPRFAAVVGTYLGLAIVTLPARALGLPLQLVSCLLVLAGTSVALYGVRHLGRSVSLMAEARNLVTNGPYALIRHPLYLGEGISLLGVTVLHFSPMAVAILVLQCAFQFQRMKNEEEILASSFPEYNAYMARTARLVPGIY